MPYRLITLWKAFLVIFAYLQKVTSFANGGSFILNSFLAFISMQTIDHYKDIVLSGSDEKSIAIPIIVEVFIIFFFGLITTVDYCMGIVISRIKKTFNKNMLWNTIAIKMFSTVFLTSLTMFIAILCESFDQDILYGMILISQISIGLMCISWELASVNRNYALLNKGKTLAILDLFTALLNIIARKTLVNRLSTFNSDITKEEIEEIENKMKIK